MGMGPAGAAAPRTPPVQGSLAPPPDPVSPMRRPLLLGTLSAALASALACGGGDAGPATQQGRRAGAGAASVPPPAPLQGKSRRQICSDATLALSKWPLDTLQADFQGTCCGAGGLPPDDIACSLDWPFSDVPPCEEWARMRNGVYARYGYPFDNAKWRAEFEATPWYTRRDDFDPTWLSPQATANIQRLKENESRKVACAP